MESMPKCFLCSVLLKHVREFKAFEQYRMPRHFRRIQFDARAQQIALGKKFPAQTTARPKQQKYVTELQETEICIKQTKSNLLVYITSASIFLMKVLVC